MRTRQILALARRSVMGTLRQPQLVVPSILFPLMLAALNTAQLGRATSLPGFPRTRSYLDFVLVSIVVQGVLFGAVGGGADMATDIEDGFFDRLLASPVSRSAILLGRLAGAAALAAFQCAVFVGVLVASGARIKGGPAGLIAIFVCGILLAVGSGGMALALALRTGSAEAVQASFPIFFVFQFLSSAFFPRTLMSGWFKSVATLNPLTWLIESLRNLVISGLTLLDVARPLLVALALCVLSISLSNLALRRRLVRAG